MNEHENMTADHEAYAGAYICGLAFVAICGVVAGFVSAWVIL